MHTRFFHNVRTWIRVANVESCFNLHLFASSWVQIILLLQFSARSQMAEAFLRHYADDKFEAYSAGRYCSIRCSVPLGCCYRCDLLAFWATKAAGFYAGWIEKEG